jgi:crotonobetainyl-CoA:carnitine CoA-transferase CaiB-like acyl-CoA transferase
MVNGNLPGLSCEGASDGRLRRDLEGARDFKHWLSRAAQLVAGIRLVGQPVTLSRTPSSMAVRPPEFGEQTDEVLAEFGFSADEIGALRQEKVV